MVPEETLVPAAPGEECGGIHKERVLQTVATALFLEVAAVEQTEVQRPQVERVYGEAEAEVGKGLQVEHLFLADRVEPHPPRLVLQRVLRELSQVAVVVRGMVVM